MPTNYGKTSSKVTHDGTIATTQIIIDESVKQQVLDFLKAHNISNATFDSYIGLQQQKAQLEASYSYIFQAQKQTYNFLMSLAEALDDQQYVIDGRRTIGMVDPIKERLRGFIFP